jgi:hypothetical protein
MAVTDNVGSVTGALSSGDTTDDTALVLSGSCEAGSTITVYDGTTELGAVTVSGTSWSFSATVADATTYQFNVVETDAAGNESATTTNFTVIGDTTAPTNTFTDASYDATYNTLTLTGTDISSLLSDGEYATTDIKENFDWSKLQWDLDSDDSGDGGYVTFDLSDIDSVFVTDDTTLTITFSSDDLESADNFDALTDNDTIEISAGFSGDSGGNVSTTDAFDGPSNVDTSIVVFDLTKGVSSTHSDCEFDPDVSYTIYVIADGSNFSDFTGPVWTGAEALGGDDLVIFVEEGVVVSYTVGGSSNRIVTREDTWSGGGYWYRSGIDVFRTGRVVWFLERSMPMISGTVTSLVADLWETAGGVVGGSGGFVCGFMTAMPSGILTSQGLA